ncbi:Putative CND5p [Penicillium brasilianum]|uniref:Putative CND5p n=1 Tax=Penicillium brasilianum TaxID=104259 RepID=A0A0F7TMB1_PENBI|nr:Putative CND5p [Penicillium brasilianum]
MSNFTFDAMPIWLPSPGGQRSVLIKYFFTLLGLAFVYLAALRIIFHPLRKIPGPKLAALTGWYEFYFDVVDNGTLVKHLPRIHQKYQSPVIRISPYHVHVNDPEFYHVVYRAGTDYLKAPYFYKGLGNPESLISILDPAKHRIFRNTIAPLFSPASIDSFAPRIHQLIQKTAGKIAEELETRQPISIQHLFRCFGVDMVYVTLFGRPDEFVENYKQPHGLIQSMDQFTDRMWLIKHFPFLNKFTQRLPSRFQLPGYASFLKQCEAWVEETRARRVKGQMTTAEGITTVFDAMLQPNEDKHYDSRTSTELIDEAALLIIAGSDTSAYTLTCATYYLLSTPVALDALREELDAKRCQRQPDAPAICAWDGNLSYQQLNAFSESFAAHLLDLGTASTSFIPLYLEKSKWTAVAMLATLKVGAAFVLLDPSHPPHRLRQICLDIRATTVLGSTRDKNIAELLGVANFIALDDDKILKQGSGLQLPRLQRSPSNPAYAVFTSGSTGRPKGVVMEHAAFTTSAQEFIQRTGLGVGSRVFQFASYAFDVSIADHLATLIAGGCVCIPSEQDRVNRLPETIQNFHVNWVDLTPSVARLLSPKQVPELRTLVLAGEPMSKQDILTWAPHVDLINHYGPAECAIGTSLSSPIEPDAEAGNIGYSMSCLSWVVDPEDHNSLLPFGEIGELVVEGHIVARGYLHDQANSDSPFISVPSWLESLRPDSSPTAPLYKTGDLVRYMSDGSMQYVGRKDNLVKIRGQRVQPEEIELYIQKCSVSPIEVAVEVVHLPGGDSALVAFVAQNVSEMQTRLLSPTGDFATWALDLQRRLPEFLPAYMIPSFALPVSRLPLTSGGKVNR